MGASGHPLRVGRICIHIRRSIQGRSLDRLAVSALGVKAWSRLDKQVIRCLRTCAAFAAPTACIWAVHPLSWLCTVPHEPDGGASGPREEGLCSIPGRLGDGLGS